MSDLVEHIKKQIKVHQEILHNLQTDLQNAETKLNDSQMGVDFSEIWNEIHPTLSADAEPFIPKTRPERTKLKWVLNDNSETYRVAIATKKGILQVKSVTDGAGDFHEDNCKCIPCSELRMITPAPWRNRRPFKKQLFSTEKLWRESLPKFENASIIIE